LHKIKNEKKGTVTVPFLFVPMATATQLQFIETTVNALLADTPGNFLVEIKAAGNDLKIFLDGDTGITIHECIKVNRGLYKLLEEEKVFPNDDFSLEVSSAGVGEPLLLHRQYVKNTGRWVEVLLNDGQVLEGELKEVQGESIIVETSTGKGKKAEVKQNDILFSNIKSTTVQIKF